MVRYISSLSIIWKNNGEKKDCSQFPLCISANVQVTNQNTLSGHYRPMIILPWTHRPGISGASMTLEPPPPRSPRPPLSSKLHAHFFMKQKQIVQREKKRPTELHTCVISTYCRPACMLHAVVQFARTRILHLKKI